MPSTKQIYFYSPNFWPGYQALNTVPVYLNSWLKNHRPDLCEQISWVGIDIEPRTPKDLISRISDLEIDILCLGLYVWNADHCFEMAQIIKTQVRRPLLILSGGPESNPNFDTEFFVKHPEIDFAVYGQGESAFVHVIDHVINGKPLSVLTAKNLAWPGPTKKMKLGQFQWINNKEGSPYLDSPELLAQIAAYKPKRNVAAVFPYESSRGCVYSCSFCDWTSGLSHKVYHRSFDIEQELDLLGKLGLTNIYFSDANFGQHRQDRLIAETMVRLKNEKNYPFRIYGQNWSKLRKKEAFEIIDILSYGGLLYYFKFAVQDTHSDILENIDRPDVPWAEHKSLIQNALARHPNVSHAIVELIQGLPGQTRDSWKANLLECQQFELLVFPFTVLSAAPVAYNPDYREKMKIQTAMIHSPLVNQFRSHCVIGSLSFDFDDYTYFTLLSELTRPQNPFSKLSDRVKLFQIIDSHCDLNSVVSHLKNLMTDANIDYSEFKQQWNQKVAAFASNVVDANAGIWPQDWLPEYQQWQLNNQRAKDITT